MLDSSPVTTGNRGRTRFLIVRVGILIFAGVIALHYTSIMLFTGTGRPRQEKQYLERGPILDRNGRLLAVQNRVSNISVWLPDLKEPEESAALLAPILSMSGEELLSRFRESASSYILLKRKIPEQEAQAVSDLKARDKLRGVTLEPVAGRSYPGKNLASHIVGYTGVDNTGLSGIEYALNDVLIPRPAAGEKGPAYGDQVFLTIDVNIQHFAEKTAARLLDQHKAESVMILVMQADTGEYLGYASAPDFDPNEFFKSDASALKNRPISQLYEPGSVFKVFSLAEFLNEGSISESSEFTCNGKYTNDFLESPITCLGIHGKVNPIDILKYSCNAGAAYASDSVSTDNFFSGLRLFGFGSTTGLELGGEESGIFRGPSQWSLRSKPSISMGQEIAVTAVQIMSAATALANHGVLLKPHIVKKITTPDGTLVRENGREVVRRVLNPEVSDSILSMMTSASETGGTGILGSVRGMNISIKTGTAQVYDQARGVYSDKKYIASSLGIFPTEDPKLIVYVVIENPMGDSHYGGRIAAPVIREAAEFLVPYLGLTFPGNRVVAHSGKVTVEMPPALKVGDTVPDFTGMSKRSVLPLFEQHGITVRLIGEGWVSRQSPPPGTPITAGMTIRLEFE